MGEYIFRYKKRFGGKRRLKVEAKNLSDAIYIENQFKRPGKLVEILAIENNGYYILKNN